MDGSLWIHGAENLFGCSIFCIFGAPCFRSGLAVDIRNLDFDVLSGVLIRCV